MATLATVAELALFMNATIAAGTDTDRATLALQIASANVRAAAGGDVSAVAGFAETQDLVDAGGVLILRHFPVSAIASVTVDGVALASTAYQWTSSGVITHLAGGWGAGAHRVVVTYSYGYATVPDDVKGVTLANAKRIYQGLEGVDSESLGSYSVNYAEGHPTFGLTEDEDKALRGYRGLAVG